MLRRLIVFSFVITAMLDGAYAADQQLAKGRVFHDANFNQLT